MVSKMLPALKMGVTLSMATAQIAEFRPTRRVPSRKSSQLVAKPSSGLKMRTPRADLPKIAVVALMASATPGPLE